MSNEYLWNKHLDSCKICRKAIRGRFAGATKVQMKKLCCEEGKELYDNFWEEVELSDMLPKLIKASSQERNEIYNKILTCSPKVILHKSIELYRDTWNEDYLLQANSLLEALDDKSWEALINLTKADTEECAYFINTILNCKNIPNNKRQIAIDNLRNNQNVEVKRMLLEMGV